MGDYDKISFRPNHRQHRFELVDETKKQPNRIFIDKKLATKVIMGCRTAAHKFRTRLGFKQYDVILTKEQSGLKKIKKLIRKRKHAKTIWCVMLWN